MQSGCTVALNTKMLTILNQPSYFLGKRRGGICKTKATWTERQQQIMHKAKQYYEVAWSGNKDVLYDVMAENHVQRDLTEGRVSEGREIMEAAQTFYNSAYKDFKITVLDIAATEDGNRAFVHFQGNGKYLKDDEGNFVEGEGKDTTFIGTSLLQFNQEGKIQESKVFREVIKA
eukprot:TRINITY_DN9387_c0_g1_i1.p1 TRINITY_DN9387_c0_g1~~TRINITY_DN9387_c0_g1_i1.p1  ORF type:complete len:174 (-),score=32.90 TRINITY_DN9387_c0_g1_i1:235-756(-)